MRYSEEIFVTKRRKTREVLVGRIGIGGDNPVRIQSMTTSPTRDVEATVNQILRLEQAGCEIVRMTVQGIKEAESCEAIRSSLLQKGCFMPLVADIHFYPPAAMKVVDWVDKVRINPGNFVDKRALFIKKEYDDLSYAQELEKIEETFAPLVLKCKALKKALRIGTNHGSLSDRIMNRYGDSPKGMVESALEFARICRKYDFHDFVFSMKASNPLVMIEAYRLLSAEMFLLNWDYPLHLGVTEAGEGEDGRIKSALGMGSLLLDGIGDTIRVSLTEDPWEEMDPCKRLVSLAETYLGKGVKPFQESFRGMQGSKVKRALSLSASTPGLYPGGGVILKLSEKELLDPGFFLSLELKEGSKGLHTPDFLWIEGPLQSQKQVDSIIDKLLEAKIGVISETVTHPAIVKIVRENPSKDEVFLVKSCRGDDLEEVAGKNPRFFLFAEKESLVHEGRMFFEMLSKKANTTPVILYFSRKNLSFEDAVIRASAECGSLLIDGLFDGICLDGEGSFMARKSLSFSLLQAARRKTVKTEFISCPGCGRTLFDLQTVSRRIRDKTAHLPGVRIAIMGCIVNGPGEMADADFGYVGSKAGKIDLYIGKSCVEKNIDFADADERLIALIKAQGKWVEPVC